MGNWNKIYLVWFSNNQEFYLHINYPVCFFNNKEAAETWISNQEIPSNYYLMPIQHGDNI